MESESIRVLNLLPDPRVGGPQTRVASVGCALKPFGIETIAALPDGPARAYFESRGIQCVSFEFERLRIARPVRSSVVFAWSLVPTARRLARLMRDERIDILHCNGLLTMAGPLAARMARAKLVWHMNDTQLPRALYRGWFGAVRSLADEIVFSSGAVADYVGGGPEAQIMYPPVDVDRFSAPADADERAGLIREHALDPLLPVVVCVGHVNRAKGHEFAIDAIGRLKKRGVLVQLVIVGDLVDRDHENRLRARVIELGLGELVRFVGRSERVAAFLRLATIFALPSLSEAMPIALLEAMASGLACVATQVAGVEEAIDDGTSGLTVPSRNGEALAQAILSLLRDPVARERMGREARTRVAQTFSLERIARAQAGIYWRLAGTPAPPYPRSGHA